MASVSPGVTTGRDEVDKTASVNTVAVAVNPGITNAEGESEKTVPVDTVAVSVSPGFATEAGEVDKAAAVDIIAASASPDDETVPVKFIAVSAIVVAVINGEVVEFEPVDIMLSIINTKKIADTVDITDRRRLDCC
jgi:hypothetical protein